MNKLAISLILTLCFIQMPKAHASDVGAITGGLAALSIIPVTVGLIKPLDEDKKHKRGSAIGGALLLGIPGGILTGYVGSQISYKESQAEWNFSGVPGALIGLSVGQIVFSIVGANLFSKDRRKNTNLSITPMYSKDDQSTTYGSNLNLQF